MKLANRSLIAAIGVGLYTVASAAVALEPGQSPPLRILSIGDSFTRAANANLPGDNVNNSWVNGYEGFWQKCSTCPISTLTINGSDGSSANAVDGTGPSPRTAQI